MKLSKKQINAIAEFVGSHHPETGAQTRGPVWRGPLPRRSAPVDYAAIPAEIAEHNAAVDARQPTLGIDPRGQLARLLSHPKVDRGLRRMILAAVQAKAPARQRRLEKAVQRELALRGI